MTTRTRAGLALASIAVIAAGLAATAMAAVPLAGPIKLPVSAAVLEKQAAAEARAERKRRRERRAPDTSFPIAGKVDYGTSENRFGNDRGDHIHEGQDVFAPAGTPLLAVRDGVVLEAGSDGGRGNYIYVYSADADETYAYFHMVEPSTLAQGEKVDAGDRLGGVGCTGSCWGDHLHFEVHEGRDPYGHAHDPLPLLKKLKD